jgi:hypothetical protein
MTSADTRHSLSGSASRLSTTLHLREAAPRRSPPQLSPLEGGITLFATSIPVCLFFIGFVKIASWIDIEKQLLLTFIPAYLATVSYLSEWLEWIVCAENIYADQISVPGRHLNRCGTLDDPLVLENAVRSGVSCDFSG